MSSIEESSEERKRRHIAEKLRAAGAVGFIGAIVVAGVIKYVPNNFNKPEHPQPNPVENINNARNNQPNP